MNKKNYYLKQEIKKIIEYKKLIKINKKIENYICLADIYIGLRKYDKALNIYNNALELYSNDFFIYYLKGNLYLDTNEYKKSINEYNNCLKINPYLMEAICNKGIAYYSIGKYEESINYYNEVISANKDIEEAYYNRGNSKQAMQNYKDACTDYDVAIKINPNESQYYYAKANALQELHQFKCALKNYELALKINPENLDATFNKSLTLLMIGEYSEGFKLYESRHKRYIDNQYIKKGKKIWDGRESIKNKIILITKEQGLGDFLQFIRLLKNLKEMGCKIILETPKSLKEIVYSMNCVDELIEDSDQVKIYDYYCPILSLPLALKIKINKIPNKTPYIYINEKKLYDWNKKIGEKNKKRIGMVWKGSDVKDINNNKNLSTRKIVLKDLLEALPENFEYYSLQKEIDENEKYLLNIYNVKDYMSEVSDFTDTGSICKLMDIIISVDTSVAHLCGALGIETWLLLPYHCDWRWMMNEEDFKWYPTIKYFKQNEDRNWGRVLKTIRNNLEKEN